MVNPLLPSINTNQIGSVSDLPIVASNLADMVLQDSSVDPSSVNLLNISDLDELPSIQLLGERISRSIDLVQDPTLNEDSETCDRRHLMNLLGVSKDYDHDQCQRLSLTLVSHSSLCSRIGSVRSWLPNHMGSGYSVAREEAKETCLPGVESMRANFSFVDNFSASCSTSYGPESFAAIVGCSRYLKPAQSLLEEVVSVGSKDVEFSSDQPFRWLTSSGRREALGVSTYRSSTPKENELHIRIVKLIALLDEIDGIYEHYYNQMEEMVSSFEVIAGKGAAKSYTSLALQAMSRHFISLRDAIIVQINVVKRELGQNLTEIHNCLSRVGVIQNQNQNQNQGWRSMRGLPENSVAILRSWLFEHFLHPYPKDSEKLLLASQTGLTKNQVSNWFINARVRLWKPMIEEMYKEEFTESPTGSQSCYTEDC